MIKGWQFSNWLEENLVARVFGNVGISPLVLQLVLKCWFCPGEEVSQFEQLGCFRTSNSFFGLGRTGRRSTLLPTRLVSLNWGGLYREVEMSGVDGGLPLHFSIGVVDPKSQ